MKSKFLISIVCILLFINSNYSFCQSWECGTDYAHNLRMQNDSEYQAIFWEISASARKYLENHEFQKAQGQVLTIPIVFHIIHLGEPIGTGSNLHDSIITKALDRLNRIFRLKTGDGIDIEIEFCLAKQDSVGNLTTGINRVNGIGVPNYQANGIQFMYSNCNSASETDIKDLSRWPVSEYYNVWIVNKICQGFGSFAGFATYPNGQPYDGAVIRAPYLSDSTTLAHELGHGLFLYHTFNGDGGNAYCPVDNSCLNDGDKICDTRPHMQYNCSSNICPGSGDWSNSNLNYMSYCGYKTRFTAGQKARMMATLNSPPRLSLLSSNGCKLTVTPTSNFPIGFSIQPNPADESFSVSIDKNPQSQIVIYIYNMQGKKVMKTFFTDISHKIITNSFSPGIYFVDVYCEGKNYGSKLLIQ